MKRRVLIAAGVALGALLLAACSSNLGMPDPVSEQANATLDLWRTFLIIAAVIAVIVYGLIGWSIIRYRKRRTDAPDAEGAQFREHLPIEIIYTAIPVFIVIGLFFLSLSTESKVSNVVADPDQVVEVEAFTWGWRFTYPETGVQVVSEPVGDSDEVGEGPELVLPKGLTTRIVLTSDDTIHAFWVPGFLYKRDAIPGRTAEFDVTPTTPGTYKGACAELCGWNHAYMTFHVRVVSPGEFQAWLSQQAAGPQTNMPTPTPPAPSPVAVA